MFIERVLLLLIENRRMNDCKLKIAWELLFLFSFPQIYVKVILNCLSINSRLQLHSV